KAANPMSETANPHVRRRPHPRAGANERDAFTLIDLIVVIAIVAFLAVTLLPALASTKDLTSRVSCSYNLKQCAIGVRMSSDENTARLPTLKFASGGLVWYPYEMARYSFPSNSSLSMGPEDLYPLYTAKFITDGRTFYCPSHPKNPNDPFSYYPYVND